MIPYLKTITFSKLLEYNKSQMRETLWKIEIIKYARDNFYVGEVVRTDRIYR